MGPTSYFIFSISSRVGYANYHIHVMKLCMHTSIISKNLWLVANGREIADNNDFLELNNVRRTQKKSCILT